MWIRTRHEITFFAYHAPPPLHRPASRAPARAVPSPVSALARALPPAPAPGRRANGRPRSRTETAHHSQTDTSPSVRRRAHTHAVPLAISSSPPAPPRSHTHSHTHGCTSARPLYVLVGPERTPGSRQASPLVPPWQAPGSPKVLGSEGPRTGNESAAHAWGGPRRGAR
jgi:hypothetical protein